MAIQIGRREFIVMLGGAAGAWPVVARGQQEEKVRRIGFLANDPTIPTTAAGAAFLDGLRENGFVSPILPVPFPCCN
jgi:putative ABC transport system substrate-binding protein